LHQFSYSKACAFDITVQALLNAHMPLSVQMRDLKCTALPIVAAC